MMVAGTEEWQEWGETGQSIQTSNYKKISSEDPMSSTATIVNNTKGKRERS
jgi:hypothetical protein